jgi:hypothetical protein
MTRKEGTLYHQPNGRWAIIIPNELRPIEITSGDRFEVEVAGRQGLQPTRMEFNHFGNGYYSVDNYPLADGLRAAIGGEA